MTQKYSKLVLDHYRHPKNFGKMEMSAYEAEEINPLCGDEIKIYLRVEDGRFEDIKYEARGCALSVATASMLSEIIKGHQIRDIKKFNKTEIEKMLKIKVGPARENCIALAVKAVTKALN